MLGELLDTVAIVHESLEGSKAFSVFLREYADLIDRGFASPLTAHNEKHKILYGVKTDSDVIVGGIVYGLNTLTKVGWIVFSFTVAEFQRKGVYTALHARMEDLLRREGAREVASHVHVENRVQQLTCKAIGMSPVYFRMSKKL